MAGETTYYNNWMNLTVKEYYWSYPGECGVSGPLVSDYMTDVWKKLKSGVNASNYLEQGGPFNGYVIETWNSVRAENTDDNLDWDIEHVAGKTVPKLTKVNHQYASAGTYGHEFGHNYAFCCDIFFEQKQTQVGTFLENEYKRIRGQDFTARTPGPERFAEDFKFFFGITNWNGRDYSNDDATKGFNIRWADEVPGLKSFIQFSWPVFNYLKDKSVSDFMFLENECNGWFRWFNNINNCWEAFAFGNKYVWSNNAWNILN